MAPNPDSKRLIGELGRLERAIDNMPQGVIDDALRDLGRTPLGRTPRPRDLPDLEAAALQPGDPSASGLIESIVQNLREQKRVIDEMRDLGLI